jgi:hypothetical protein
MKRLILSFLLPAVLGVTAFAQTSQPQTAQSPEPRRLVAPVRGEAEIEILRPELKQVKNAEGRLEAVTKLKIRNISKGAIALLTVSDTWYDKQGNVIPGDQQKYRKPFLPGQIIEMELHTPKNPGMFQNAYQFSHANGKIKVTTVKNFPSSAPTKKD